MPHRRHYQQHIEQLSHHYQVALDAYCEGFGGVVIHSGSEHFYYDDDQSTPFRAYAHFTHWLPLNQTNQVLLVIPNCTPVLFRVNPSDYWHETAKALPDWVVNSFDIIDLRDCTQIEAELSAVLSRHKLKRDEVAFIGENTQFAKALGLDEHCHNPSSLLHYLNYQRAYKSHYEVACIRKANRLALEGHQAARHAFFNNGSEYDIHMAYLQACKLLEHETPYPNIIALDEKAATLHYQNKRKELTQASKVLLIDAGYQFNAYCADISRTYAKPEAHPVFLQLLERMQELQTHLVTMLRPGQEYLNIHIEALKGIADILTDLDICRGSPDEVFDQGVSRTFMPHGVGHMLGLQVHDVGGRQLDREGRILAPPEYYPALRTTRTIEAQQVFTIEPGCYFIPALLQDLRDSKQGKLINWSLIEKLLPLGGIRIEDNVLASEGGADNLTRLLL
ncbi:MAG: Xaa-Pro dipeptidase [Pseudohongiellaceae bacterium]|nr:Xaa-Pro dipeptidase [Pseudohongiellaceae bacterium]